MLEVAKTMIAFASGEGDRNVSREKRIARELEETHPSARGVFAPPRFEKRRSPKASLSETKVATILMWLSNR